MVERAGLGVGRRQVVVPAQSGRAVSVRCGDLVRVVDIEGHQVGDLWAVDAADHGRWLSVSQGVAGHPNCRDNFLAAAASAGIVLPFVPDPVNLFRDSGPRPDGTLAIGVASSSLR